MAHNGKMVMMMVTMIVMVMMLWFTMAREMTIKIKMILINARVKKARGALARLSGNFHISTH